jgi:hypothetical protein
MTVNELKQVLDSIAWEEQIDFELSERECGQVSERTNALESKISQIARSLSPALLNELQQDEGYVAWTLRLSPKVPGDRQFERARPYLQHPDATVRYWAVRIIEHIDRPDAAPKDR